MTRGPTSASSSCSSSKSADSWKEFVAKSEEFLKKTQQYALEDVNPGGYYKAVWCRDASYILRDWFLTTESIDKTLQQIHLIWSHQITPGKEKIIYGRGSPEMKFLSLVAKTEVQRTFEGALPTTIYQDGFSEVYGQNPDIDSTALMISTTSWIFDMLLKEGSTKRYQSCSTDASATRVSLTSNFKERDLSVNSTIKQENIDFLVPRMLKAIDYLTKRDMDGDGLLEQNHNEDWMDTVLRTGKIVYSQACLLLALNDFASLLIELGRDSDANSMKNLANKTTKAVEQKLWSEEDGCYIDIQESHHIGGPYRTLTQDVSLYLVAISENLQKNNSLKTYRVKDHQTNRDLKIREDRESDSKGSRAGYNYNTNNHRKERALHTLDAMKKRLWKDKWPLVTEVELKSTGPWVLKPNFYHNHTFWPWITGIEILARSRFDQLDECNILLSKLASEENHPHIHTFYEWINPATDQGEGAYPFRTGISAVRIAIADIVWKFKRRYFKE